VNKQKIKWWLLEWTIHLCIVALVLFLLHAYETWGSWLALAGLFLIIGLLTVLGLWGYYCAHMKMEYDEEIETTDSIRRE
jgi:hypothetical protein